jgi:hypothetical protein
MVARFALASNFFDVPPLSRASQSMSVYAGKIRNAWPLILRNSLRLLWRFRPRFSR